MPRPSVLCIVPARQGSQRIPGKNFRLLAGLSPLDRAIGVCREVFGDRARIVVSSDAPTPRRSALWDDWHQRPACLATAMASMVGVVLDVLDVCPGQDHQRILLIQPTQPLRLAEHLQSAFNLLRKYPSVVSIAESPISVDKLFEIRGGSLLPLGWGVEQDQGGCPTYYCDGTVYGFRRDWFVKRQRFCTRSTHTLLIPQAETCRLDTPRDWAIAEMLLTKDHKHGKTRPSASSSHLSDVRPRGALSISST